MYGPPPLIPGLLVEALISAGGGPDNLIVRLGVGCLPKFVVDLPLDWDEISGLLEPVPNDVKVDEVGTLGFALKWDPDNGLFGVRIDPLGEEIRIPGPPPTDWPLKGRLFGEEGDGKDGIDPPLGGDCRLAITGGFLLPPMGITFCDGGFPFLEVKTGSSSGGKGSAVTGPLDTGGKYVLGFSGGFGLRKLFPGRMLTPTLVAASPL